MKKITFPTEWAPKVAELEAYIAGLNLSPDDDRRQGCLIQVLHKAQHIFGYLPREVQALVAEKLYLQEAAVSGVVSFYNYFTTKPKGKYVVNVCMGTACYVKGADIVLKEFEKQLNVTAGGDISEDGLFSVCALRCVGACGLAPVLMVNEKVHGRVKPEDVKTIIAEYKERG